MIQHRYLFTILLIIAVAPQYQAMESKLPVSTPDIITALTSLENLSSIICFPNNIVAVAGTKGCSLYDYSANKQLMQLNNTAYPAIAAHPNKTMLAILNKDNEISDLTIYDIPTGNKIWQKSEEYWHTPPSFDPTNSTILVCNAHQKILSMNYHNNSQPTLPPLISAVGITCHPQKQHYITFRGKHISILSLDNNAYVHKKLPLDGPLGTCAYSADGSLIALYTPDGLFLLNTESNTKDYLDDNFERICSLAWHPSSFILATLSDKYDKLYYWNIKNGQLLNTMILTSSDSNKKFFLTHRMSFSCDGTRLIIAQKNGLLVLKVPFEVLYQPNTKNKCIFTCFMMHNYFYDKNPLPRDITQLLIKYLLAASQYSFTNY